MPRIRTTKASAAFLAVWRRLARGETIPPLHVGDEAQAVSLRMKFYQVIRPYRHLDDSHPDFDPELQDAADRYAVRARGEWLEFGEKIGEAQADMLIEKLGLTPDEVMTPEERAFQSRLAGLATKED